MRSLNKYIAIFWLSSKHSIKNYKLLIGLSLFLLACMVIFANLWKVAVAKTGVIIFTPAELLWYIAFNEWVLTALPDVEENIEQDLKSGRLAYLLPRPISYLGATFAEALGTLCVNLLVFGVVTFTYTWWQVGAPEFSFFGFLLTLVFALFAGILGVLFQMIIGMAAFWIHEVTPFYWVWEKMLFMLGGLILPLALYPVWLQTIAKWTPFPAILGERSALALEFNAEKVSFLSLNLFVWIALVLFALIYVYRRGLRILNIEGG